MNFSRKRFVQLAMTVQLLLLPAIAAVPQSRHVWLVTEENHSYEDVIANMPYLVSIANQYGTATESYSDMHNSIATLMHLVAGATVTTDNVTTSIFDADNVARNILAAGLTWRSYQESLPFAGDTTVEAYPYVKRHNPLAYFTDTNTSGQKQHWTPYPANISSVVAGNFNYVTPNLLDDAHDGTMATADDWLRQHLPAILARPEFQAGGDGIMIITFDEGDVKTDDRCSATVLTGCGGHIFTAVIGPQVKRGYQSSLWHNHESVLKTICEALRLGMCPGAAETSNDLGEFFDWSAAPAACDAAGGDMSVTLCTPEATLLSNSVAFQAATRDLQHPVIAMIIYVDSIERYFTPSASLDTVLTLPPGTHSIVVRAWDSSGARFSTWRNILVAGCTAASASVNVCSPQSGATLANPVHVVTAAGGSSHPITATSVYIDGVKRYWTNSAVTDTFLTLTGGSHSLVVRAWDSSGISTDVSAVVGVN